MHFMFILSNGLLSYDFCAIKPTGTGFNMPARFFGAIVDQLGPVLLLSLVPNTVLRRMYTTKFPGPLCNTMRQCDVKASKRFR